MMIQPQREIGANLHPNRHILAGQQPLRTARFHYAQPHAQIVLPRLFVAVAAIPLEHAPAVAQITPIFALITVARPARIRPPYIDTLAVPVILAETARIPVPVGHHLDAHAVFFARQEIAAITARTADLAIAIGQDVFAAARIGALPQIRVKYLAGLLRTAKHCAAGEQHNCQYRYKHGLPWCRFNFWFVRKNCGWALLQTIL